MSYEKESRCFLGSLKYIKILMIDYQHIILSKKIILKKVWLFGSLIRHLSNYINIEKQIQKKMNDIFKALNDPTRREILSMLREGDMTAGDIAARFEMSAPSISHHLDKLKRAGLVTTIKQGQFVMYSINTTIVDDLLQYILTFKK